MGIKYQYHNKLSHSPEISCVSRFLYNLMNWLDAADVMSKWFAVLFSVKLNFYSCVCVWNAFKCHHDMIVSLPTAPFDCLLIVLWWDLALVSSLLSPVRVYPVLKQIGVALVISCTVNELSQVSAVGYLTTLKGQVGVLIWKFYIGYTHTVGG